MTSPPATPGRDTGASASANEEPRVWISSLTFNSGATISFAHDDLVLVVGANNTGKSQLLREVDAKFRDNNATTRIVTGVTRARSSTPADLAGWLGSVARPTQEQGGDPGYHYRGMGFTLHAVSRAWAEPPPISLGDIARLFCQLLSTDARLRAADPATTFDAVHTAPENPIQALHRDDRLETLLSDAFRKAFGTDLIVNRGAGGHIPLHVGDRPVPRAGEDRVSFAYLSALAALPQLQSQGDGMRSFTGILLHSETGRESVLLVDEPEAFLHPPQATLLGSMLAGQHQGRRQLFVGTHSGDVVRGFLNAAGDRTRILRLSRSGVQNPVAELDRASVSQLWADPLLRHSNILDGLFHELVIICEADADARFYSAVASALEDSAPPGRRRRDTMFVHCGGKDRIPVVAKALSAVNVPVAVVADFDSLGEENPLSRIVDACGGDWDDVRHDWRRIKSAVDATGPAFDANALRQAIGQVTASIVDSGSIRTARSSIKRLLQRAFPWGTAKEKGASYLPPGPPTDAWTALDSSLAAIGVFIVPVGELEGFLPSITSHGPRWVNEALKRDLLNDAELAPARAFVGRVIGLTAP